MYNAIVPKYSFYVIAPFNSKMVIDYSSLIGKYEDFRRLMCANLQTECPDQVLIEKFANEKNPFKRIRKWMREQAKEKVDSEEELLFKGTGGSGAMKRDKSIITIQLEEKIELPKNIIGVDVFSASPTLIVENMSFHEYGIGMLFCKVDLSFNQDFMNINPRKVMADLLDQILRNDQLLEITKSTCSNVLQEYNKGMIFSKLKG